ncbi:MAG: LPXTG cell wall anchor domain-containing protein, partial [Turicibacter sp.]|nr:LPXTG cell wall anchor domain-containing protein [Turicibacter sp.]
DDNQSGTTTPENKPSTDNNGTGIIDSDNHPETGVEAQLPLIISGALAVVAGMWLLLKRKVVKK